MELPPEKIRFWKVLSGLVNFVSELVKKNPGVTTLSETQIKVVNVALAAKNKEEMIKNYKKSSEAHWEYIRLEDEKFFLEKVDKLFSGFPKEYVSQLELLFKNGNINSEDKSVLWRFLKSLTRITIKYAHKNGENVSRDIKLWEIKL